MKTTQKTTKKVGPKKISSAKVTPKKKVVTKKVVASPKRSLSSKKSVTFKRPTVKKAPASKTTHNQFKPMGIIAILIGVIILATLIVVALPSMTSQTASNDTSVLGWFSNLKVSRVKLSVPSGLKISSADGINTLTWGKVSNATGYDIWRKEGFFGKISVVGYASNGVSMYIDETAIPGRAYYYGITATKGTSKSSRSRLSKKTTSRLSAPVVKFDNFSSYSTSATIEVNLDKTNNYDGLYVYCDKCEKKRIEISPSSPDLNKYYEVGGRGYNPEDGGYGVILYMINGLLPETEYSFQVSEYKIYSGKRIESARTSNFTISTPVSVTGLMFDSYTGEKPVLNWDIPEVDNASWSMQITCDDTRVEIFSDDNITPVQLYGGTGYTPGVARYNFNAPTITPAWNYEKCYVNLMMTYMSESGEQIKSRAPIMGFNTH